LGVGIGFGLQNVVNNFVSGLILLFERPIDVGDTIEFSDTSGTMKHIGIRASVIRTFDGAEVIVPNGMLISESVTNWTLSDRRRRIDLAVGVEYGTPAQRVIDLLVGVAKANPKVISDPEPHAFFEDFGDSSLDFRLRAWIDPADSATTIHSIRSEIAVAVQQALDDAGIGVPFPQRDLHLISVPPSAASDLGTTKPQSDPGEIRNTFHVVSALYFPQWEFKKVNSRSWVSNRHRLGQLENEQSASCVGPSTALRFGSIGPSP
jgi:potassium efflux system protein